MSTRTIARPCRLNEIYISSFKQSSSRRSFITLPGTETQTLKATRILPYKPSSLYSLIADVDNYSSFLPYCIDSRVTKWSAPDDSGKCWPSEADLKVGWGGYEETFTSRLFCVPSTTVEALGGEAITTLPKSSLSHYSKILNYPNPPTTGFKSLSTRWNIVPLNGKPDIGHQQTEKATRQDEHQTEVQLTIDFQFENPLYAALTKAAAPRVAGIMIEAFEAQARKQLAFSGVQRKHGSDPTCSVTNEVKI